MAQKVQCGLKRAEKRLVCSELMEMSSGREGPQKKEVWRCKLLGQVLEVFDYLAKKFELSLFDIGELLKVWSHRLIRHYWSHAFI